MHSDPDRHWPADPPPECTHQHTHSSTNPGRSESEVINSQEDYFRLPAAINFEVRHINVLLAERRNNGLPLVSN